MNLPAYICVYRTRHVAFSNSLPRARGNVANSPCDLKVMDRRGLRVLRAELTWSPGRQKGRAGSAYEASRRGQGNQGLPNESEHGPGAWKVLPAFHDPATSSRDLRGCLSQPSRPRAALAVASLLLIGRHRPCLRLCFPCRKPKVAEAPLRGQPESHRRVTWLQELSKREF